MRALWLALAVFGCLFEVSVAAAQTPTPSDRPVVAEHAARAVEGEGSARPSVSAELPSAALVRADSSSSTSRELPAVPLPTLAGPSPAVPPAPPVVASTAAAPLPEPVAGAVPSAAASGATSLAPAPSASKSSVTLAAQAASVARLGDTPVFTLNVARANKGPDARAREASDALQRAFNADKNAPVTVRRDADVAVVLVGRAPIVQLTQEDADAAGEPNLDAYAASIASRVREALDSEGRRADIAKSVFSVSLLVFFGLIAFYLIRKVGEFSEKAREFLDRRADRELSIKVRRIEVVRPATLRSSAVMAISLGKWLGQVAIAYAWLVVVLSLFDATRDYTRRLTGFVLGPVSQLMERLASTLPLLIVAAIAALAVFVLVRFVGLFFASVARGETPLPWLPVELAAPTSVLLRSTIVIAGLVFAAPIVTGDANGALARVGGIVLVALGLASTPLLASAFIGVSLLFGRRLRLGEYVEVNAQIGRISSINLLEMRLLDVHHAELRVPHLVCLFRPVRVLGSRPRLSVEVPVSAEAQQERVREVLTEAARKCGTEPKLELLSFDASGVIYRVSALCGSLDGSRQLRENALAALTLAGISLGRLRREGSE